MLGSNQKDKKKSFLKALPQLSLFKPNEKSSTVGKKEKHFSFTKRSEKDQLKADWRNTCVEMNKRAQNLQVKIKICYIYIQQITSTSFRML